MGITAITIGRYERGEIKPSIEIAMKIAEALEFSLDYLVGSSDAVQKKPCAINIVVSLTDA